MKNFIYHSFYGKPLNEVIQLMIVLLLIWTIIYGGVQYNYTIKKIWDSINVLMLTGNIVVIIVVTLSSRGGVSELILMPFQSFKAAKIQPEIYRSMLMNVFLFFPLGLTLPYALPKKWKHNVLIAILFALTLSITIEFLQYYFHLGRAETDDVICNTLGCAIGTIAFRLNGIFEGNGNSN